MAAHRWGSGLVSNFLIYGDFYSLGNQREVLEGLVQVGVSQKQQNGGSQVGFWFGISFFNAMETSTHLAIRGKSLRASSKSV